MRVFKFTFKGMAMDGKAVVIAPDEPAARRVLEQRFIDDSWLEMDDNGDFVPYKPTACEEISLAETAVVQIHYGDY